MSTTILALDLGSTSNRRLYAVALFTAANNAEDCPPSASVWHWREIPSWSAYEISSRGDIRRVIGRNKRHARNCLSVFVRENGYAQVILHQQMRRKRFLVHRLVALTFLGEQPSSDHEVAHLDGSRLNNYHGNLCWVLHRENERHKVGHGTRLRGSQVGTAVLNESQVREIKRQLASGESQSSLARHFGVNVSTVHLIAKGKWWRHVQ